MGLCVSHHSERLTWRHRLLRVRLCREQKPSAEGGYYCSKQVLSRTWGKRSFSTVFRCQVLFATLLSKVCLDFATVGGICVGLESFQAGNRHLSCMDNLDACFC